MTAYEVSLAGCRPEPLASYLKALGILRLVGEQVDRDAAGRWDGYGFTLRSTLDEEGLEDFLLHRYRPTPVVSPWNNSSGFGPEGKGELQVIEASTDERLATYRKAIAVTRGVLGRFQWDTLDKKAKEAKKPEVVRACRSELPDECLAWVDAAVVLASDKPAFPPLLGTGGNVGRLDLSRNFHQRLLDVFGLKATENQRANAADRSEAWVRDSLWDLGNATGIRGSSSQFDPGAVGGTSSSPLGKAPLVTNPWDYVLMIEGAVLFAAGNARRLGVGTVGLSAAPFCAYVAPVGYGGAAADEPTKGEVWLPLWQERFVSFPELRRLMAEGRIDWRGGHARTGLDFAKAASTLGVDRGITAFSRYVLADRFGQATVAVPAGRVAVGEHDTTVFPLAELDRWLDQVRWGNPPASVRQALRRVDQASFEVARGTKGALLRVLVEVAALEMAVGRATRFRTEADVSPVFGLTARRWVPALLDSSTADFGFRGTPELRLAVALASAHDRAGSGRTVSASLRTMLRPVRFGDSGPKWRSVASVEGFGVRPVIGVVAAAHVRRVTDLLGQRRRSRDGHPREAGQADPEVGRGFPTWFTYGRSVLMTDIAALVRGTVDEKRFGDLLAACLLLDWRQPLHLGWRAEGGSAPGSAVGNPVWVPPALTVLGPFYAGPPRSRPRPSGMEGPVAVSPVSNGNAGHAGTLYPEPEWVALLAAGRAEQVLTRALHRLRIAGHDPVLRVWPEELRSDREQSVRLAAALLFPLSNKDGAHLFRRACPPDPAQDQASQTKTKEVHDAQP
ncbi:MAG: type I-G CRISPR-associated protein Cas8g1/Csx17 [Acidimicrobiales bacterium]